MPDENLMSRHLIADMPEHQAISMLLPWYVNGTLSAFDRQRVDSHVPNCTACRNDLELERRIYARMATDVVLEHIPAASLKRLHGRLDAREDGTSPEIQEPRQARRPSLPWLSLAAASIAGILVTIGVYTVRGGHASGNASSPAYYTVTSPEPRPSSEVIRAVFAPTVTLVELQALLDEAQLKIVSGPTEAGVYSLSALTSRPVGLSLALLRQHRTVRFAEITRDGPSKPKADDVP
jgi:anti-sigma factor RsiW